MGFTLSELLGSKEVFLKAGGGYPDAAELAGLFVPAGFFIARIDGASIKDKKALLSALASGLRFPAYFGGNWDALLDCLRSLPEFSKAAGYAVIVENSGYLLKNSPEDMDDFRDIAGTAAEFLAEKYKIPLKILML